MLNRKPHHRQKVMSPQASVYIRGGQIYTYLVHTGFENTHIHYHKISILLVNNRLDAFIM